MLFLSARVIQVLHALYAGKERQIGLGSADDF